MAIPLIGRGSEVAALTAALTELAAGRGGLVVLTGEAGVGKSRLAAEVAELARQRGAAVLTGRAVEASSSPMRPITEAFLAAFRDRPPPPDPALAPFRAMLGALVPEWRAPSGAAPAAGDPVVRNEGILRLLRSLGGPAGCVLVVEDLHWADAETLTVVEYLAVHATAQPVLCLATVRSEQPSDGLRLARSLAASGAGRVVELVRLGDAEIAEIARATAGGDLDPEAVAVVCRRAEGLPLLAEDLVVTACTTAASVEAVVPLTFAGTVQSRLGALGPEAVAVVQAAATLGRRFDWRLLPAVAGVDDATVAGVLRAATDARLVSVAPDGGFAFRHALTRDAVAGELLPAERAVLARRALAVVEAAHPGLPGEACELAAALAGDAGLHARAAALLVESARRALGAGALSAADAALNRARAFAATAAHSGDHGAAGDAGGVDPLAGEIDKVHLEVLSLAGRTDEALELGATALARQDAAGAAGTHLRLARAAAAATRWDTARRHLDSVRRLASAGSEAGVRADALGATVAVTEGRTADAVELAERALAAAGREGVPEAACEALEVLGRVARPVDLDEAERRFSEAAATARSAGLRLWELRALHELGTVDMFRLGSLERLELARRLADESGAPAIAAVVDLQLASSYALRFEPESALRSVERGVEIARLFDLGLALPMFLVQGACAHATAGRGEEMEAAIAEAARLSDDHPEVWAVAWGHCRAVLALLEERRADAYAALRQALTWASRPECAIPGVFGGWLAVVATLDDDGLGGDGDDNPGRGARARAEVAVLPGSAIPANQATLRYAEAIALGRAGRGAEAADLVAEADGLVAARQGWDAWRILAHRLVSEAALADGWGDPVGWLREVLVWAEARGHRRMVVAVRSLLQHAGAPVPRRGRGESAVPAALAACGVTSREVDVLALVARGLTNGQIAERLYLSPRTVEKHVERLRDKTAAADRAALAGVAAKYGVAGG